MLWASLAPILVTVMALLFGMKSLYAALSGILTTLLIMTLGFFIDDYFIVLQRWLPILIEVVLILAGGLWLAHALQQSGAQQQLAQWVQQRLGNGVGAILMVVHGVVPFAESLTGFGLGIAVGIPLLLHMGLSKRHAAAIGLLGLCAVPWGSMGPGTLIAAKMSHINFNQLGFASALLSFIPFIITGAVAAYMVSPPQQRFQAIFQGIASGVVLTILIASYNWLFGTPVAGALGALTMMLLRLMFQTKPSQRLPLLAKQGLLAYAVLLGGVLSCNVLLRFVNVDHVWQFIASPGLWLLIASIYFCQRHGLIQSTIQTSRRVWMGVAPVTAAFMILGILMAESGMANFLAQQLAQLGSTYIGLAPFVAASGGFITGSNSAANAMFAAPQAQIGHLLQLDLLWFMAIHNVCAAFLLMGSPAKIEMALSLCQSHEASDRKWVFKAVIGVAFIVVTLLAATSIIVFY